MVEDNEDSAEVLASFLEILGYQCSIAHNDPAALQTVKTTVPHVALLDIGLPVLDGYELARNLRRDGRLQYTRLIALIAYGQESDRQRTWEAGFDAHLANPVDLQELQATLGNLGWPAVPLSLSGALGHTAHLDKVTE